MNKKILSALLLVLFSVTPFSAYPLSLQEVKWADGQTFSGSLNSQWFEIRHFQSIDYTVTSTSGTGTMVVEYAPERDGTGAIEDTTSGTFNTTESAKLYGTGITAFFTRLKITCGSASCTLSSWFNAKGEGR